MKGIVFYGQNFPVIREDTEALKENITRILFTSPGERVNNPLFGSRLKSMLFDIDSSIQEDVEREIKSSVSRWEPRVTVGSVRTEKIENGIYFVALTCIMLETLEVFNYERLLKL